MCLYVIPFLEIIIHCVEESDDLHMFNLQIIEIDSEIDQIYIMDDESLF